MNGNGAPATVRLKFLALKIGSGKTPLGGSQVYQDSGVLFIRSQNVYDDGLQLDDAVFISEEIDEEMAISRVQPGDVLLNITGASIGRVCAVPQGTQRANVNQHVCIIRPRLSADSRFLAYSLQSGFGRSQVFASEVGVSREGLTFEQVGNLQIPAGENKQQTRVASFLDAKLGRLDELMRKKERQLVLLAEKRQALISHAVTRGLNPEAPTKPSGVPQLGDVPAHWTPTRLKYLARIRYGLGQPPKPQADGLRMIRATNVDAGRITPENMAFIDPSEVPESRDATLKAGEIIVVRSGAYTCDSAIIPAEYEGSIAGYDMIVRVKKAEPVFVAFSLLSGAVRDAQLKPCSLRAAQPHLNAEELGDCVLAIPPREEQQAIVSFLNTATTRLDAVTAVIKSQHAKLCEYRQALITAAVTGQVAIPEEAV